MRQPSEPLAGEFRRLLRAAQAEHRLPSVGAAVVSGGDVVWSEAVGLADVAAGVRATPETQYRIGSITKTFTAAAIMQLRDAGELDLEDRLERHLPAGEHGGATLRTMLSHLSGLQREVPGELWESLEFPSRDELLRLLGEAEGVLPPGEHWHYSNLAFAVLGEVVARRSGMPAERYIEQRLLEPVGLGRTTWEPRPPHALGYFVEPYEDVVREAPLVDLRAKAPAGQLWSTTLDLCRWGSFLADPAPDILRPETALEMQAFHGLADPERWRLGWGLGLSLFRDGDRVFFGHDGGMPGFIARLAYCRREKVGAAALTNSGTGLVLEELCLELAVRAAEQLAASPEEWQAGGPAPPELTGLLGRWWLEGMEFVLTHRGGRLEGKGAEKTPADPPAVFAPDGPDRFRVVSGRERGELLRVVRDADGRPVKLLWATYPMTREPVVFGPSEADGEGT